MVQHSHSETETYIFPDHDDVTGSLLHWPWCKASVDCFDIEQSLAAKCMAKRAAKETTTQAWEETVTRRVSRL